MRRALIFVAAFGLAGCSVDRTGTFSGGIDGGGVDGAPADCSEGETRCLDDIVEACAAGRWTLSETCGDTCVLVGGVAQCGTCGAGDLRCNGAEIEVCDASGDWSVETSCPVCTMDAAGPRCLDCAPTDRRCDGDDLQACVDGSWVTEERCPTGCGEAPSPGCRCAEGATQCGTDGAIERCAGGVWSAVTACDLGCVATPSPACRRFIPSNIPVAELDALLHETLPDIVIEGSLNTDDCDPSFPSDTIDPGGGLPGLCVYRGGNVTVRGARVTGSRALVILAWGTVRVEGTLDASSTLLGPGLGAASGSGPETGGNSSHNDAGGGGGGACGRGGDGGTSGSQGAGGAGDVTYLGTPLVGGADGGDGGGGGSGGPGGGAVQISARGAITMTGTASIDVSGGGASAASNGRGGPGGGSGGTLLIESGTSVTVDPMARIYGGGGGGASGSCNGNPSNPGADGSGSTARAPGGTPPMACRGGASGNHGVPRGENGADDMEDGGGGGGAGCLVVRTPDGAGTPAFDGTSTSAVVSGAATVFD